MIPLLAKQGYYVVAPDQRGYGRTTGWDTRSYAEVDLRTFAPTNLVRDVIVLVNALGYTRVRCVVGHDFGAVPAAFSSLTRPDMFESLVLLSHPFAGVPPLPLNTANMSEAERNKLKKPDAWQVAHQDLAKMNLKHYQKYYSTAPANDDMVKSAQGLDAFIRGYFHLKSASWAGNHPAPLQSVSAGELAKMPWYYIMPADKTMAEAVAQLMEATEKRDELASEAWFPDDEVAIYAAEFGRTGFQGGLNWYRIFSEAAKNAWDQDIFAGKKIDIPCSYASGAQDWGTYQKPGSLDKMVQGKACSDFRGVTLTDGAGHFMPQEAPEATAEVILNLVTSLE